MAESYKHLEVWKDAVILAESIYLITKKYPKEETFNCVTQLRRAVVSVSSNIAEGSSRKSKKDFSRFIEIARGSLYEIESLIEISLKLEYITVETYTHLTEDINKLGGKLGAFYNYLQK
ncbi:MAG: four helix bundle protein [Candidatus Pacebacteria bacterium]|nr:four helix bundle protein [Candidatus Paceibacterota bacterium]MBP9866500.1 four helix bundle protein [Candidatus Paceibacterota bacterium]